MGRSAFASRVVAVVAFLAPVVACSAFVDLDGLGDGKRPTGDDGSAADVVASEDATSSDSGGGNDVVVEDAPVDVSFDVDATAPCPGTGGPSAIRIATQNGSFCIDATEVTRAQYNQFIAANVSPTTQSALCQWNTNFTPKADWPAALATPTLPVGFVNWCDAEAFCKWAGKRLCGRVGISAADGGTGGAPMTVSEYGNNLLNEHSFACSHATTRVYPYGNTFDATKCNGGSTNEPDTIEPVKFRPACESGYGGVFDLAGNVHEWANGCVVGADPKLDKCAVQGSAYTHADSEMVCISWFEWERSNVDEEVGFRCCSD